MENKLRQVLDLLSEIYVKGENCIRLGIAMNTVIEVLNTLGTEKSECNAEPVDFDDTCEIGE